jgi:hypothetical protein
LAQLGLINLANLNKVLKKNEKKKPKAQFLVNKILKAEIKEKI